MLPPIARRRAGEAAGLSTSWPREQTVVIGDTPRDIACAHADDLRCVAVTTGPHARAELSGADVVVDSTAELLEALDSLTALRAANGYAAAGADAAPLEPAGAASGSGVCSGKWQAA